MTPALRLVVTWMVCALAVAVWYRARWWQDAEPAPCPGMARPANLPIAQHDWCDLDVTADWNGRVDRIVISNPLGRGVDMVISVF